MGTHMRTMNNNIGRLDTAMGVMTEQHTELMSVLRMGFQQRFNPSAPGGQPPAAATPPASGPHSAVVPYAPVAPVAHQPPGSTLSRTATPRQRPHATTSSRSAIQSSRIVPPSSSSPRKSSSRVQASSDDGMDVDGGDEADTEEEIPEPLPVPVKTSKLKLKGMPRPRDPVRKALLVRFQVRG